MKTATCECGHQETGATEKDAMNKLQSHMHNAHGGRSADVKRMMKQARHSLRDAVVG